MAACLHLLCAAGAAKDCYVDNVAGDDAFDGAAPAPAEAGRGPFRTIGRALRAAGAGDTVHLNPTGQVYRDAADFYGHPGGEAGSPIVLDGHGATLSGADPCAPPDWKPRKDGVWVCPKPSSGFLVVEGRMVFELLARDALKEGEFCYEFERLYFLVPSGKKVEQFRIAVGQGEQAVPLEPARWQRSHSKVGALQYPGLSRPAWVELDGRRVELVDPRDRLGAGQWSGRDGAIAFRPPDGQAPADLAIERVVRANAVQLSGRTAHVVVRNLHARHFHNDGFNIHGAVADAVFLNVTASHLGDEGFSSHDDCQTILDGAVFRFCCNGIFNVNRARTVTRNVILADNREVGFGCHEQAQDVLENVILIDNPSQLSVVGAKVDNALIVRTAGADVRSQAMHCQGSTVLRRVTAAGNADLLRSDAGAETTMQDCLLAPGQGAVHVRADDPAGVLRLRNVRFGAGTKVEWGSRWPWKALPVEAWVEEVRGKGVAEGVAVVETDFHEALVAGRRPERLPEGAGCSAELIERFAQFLRARDQAPTRPAGP